MWTVDSRLGQRSDRGGSEVNGGEIAGRLVEANEEGNLAIDVLFYI